MALRLGGALQRLWQARGHLSKGRTFLERTLAESEGTPSPVPYKGLTTREREVATLIAQGKTNRSIAVMLVVSERTVEAHVSNILAKLDVTSRSQIAVWAGCSDVLKPAGGLLQKQSHPRF